MALINFLQNTCNIKQTVTVNNNWIQSKTLTNVYTWIPCHIYSAWGIISDTDVSVNTKKNEWAVILEPSRINTRAGQIIEIVDPDIWILWTYQITSIKMNRLANWTNDSLQLNIKSL